MKHIYQRGDSWYYQFTVRGHRYQGAIGSVSKAVAREIAEKKRVEALEGKLVERPLKAPQFGRYDVEKKQFTDAAGKYLDYYRQQHKPRSALRMHTALMRLSGFFNGKRLNEIDPFTIERYKASRKDAGMADATVNRELACLKNLYNLGIKWGWLRDNPVRHVKLFRENNARQRWLTVEEEAALLEKCDQKLRTFVIVAVDTGFRVSELRSLRWQEVDFPKGNLSVASGYTKNGDPRRNPMTQRVEAALRDWQQITKGRGAETVFGLFGYRSPFQRARKASGLGEDVCFHSLRHTFVSRLVSAGVDLRTVQELAGHKTISMTMRYAHIAPENKKRAIALLETEVTAKMTTIDFGLAQRNAVSACN